MKWGRENATDEEIWDALTTAQAREIVENKDGQLDFQIGTEWTKGSFMISVSVCTITCRCKETGISVLDDSAENCSGFCNRYCTSQISPSAQWKCYHLPGVPACCSIRQADLILVLDDGELVGKGIHVTLSAPAIRTAKCSPSSEEREKYNTSIAVSVNASEVTL